MRSAAPELKPNYIKLPIVRGKREGKIFTAGYLVARPSK
jgi:hypothetical protein